MFRSIQTLTAILALVAVPTALAGPIGSTANYINCYGSNPEAVVAIVDFCQGASGALMIPSEYASTGKSYGNTLVYVDGNCSPAQWLPTYWCEQQFYQMCGATLTEEGGFGRVDYGDNGCQHFIIQEI